MDERQARARCWLEVDLGIVEANYCSARQICGEDVQIIPVLKANAYGLGAAKLSQALYALGARLFAVAELNEALEVMRASGGDALVLGMIAPSQMDSAARAGAIATVYDLEQARQLDAAAERAGCAARVHVKLDTGLHRLGFDPERPGEILEAFALPHLRVEGLFTHLALRDEQGDARQISRLLTAADGRRLSKRDRDLDLGLLRQHYTAAQLIGKLAHAAGLIDSEEPCTADELIPLFSWDKVPREDIAFDLK